MARSYVAMAAAILLVVAACGARETVELGSSGPGARDPFAAPLASGSDEDGDAASSGGLAGSTGDGSPSGGEAGEAGKGPGAPTATPPPTAGGGAEGAPVADVARTGRADPGVSGTRILLGNVTSISGAMAGQFDGAPNAASAYFRNINERGGWRGRKIELQVRDDGLDGTRNLAETKRLVEESKVFAFVANTSPVQSASGPYLRDRGMPLVSIAVHTLGCTDPNVVPCALSSTHWAAAVQQYLGPKGIKAGSKAAVVWLAQQISRDQARAVSTALRATGWEVVFSYEAQLVEPDFTAAVLGARQAGADFVFSVMEISANSRFVRAAQRQGWKPGMFTFTGYDDRYIKQLGAAVDGQYAQGMGPHLFTDDFGPMNEYRRVYSRYYPNANINDSTFAMGAGWQMARLFFERGLAHVGTDITRTGTLDALRQTRDWTGDGLFNPITIMKDAAGNDHPPGCVSLVKIVNQRFEMAAAKVCGPVIRYN